RRGGHGGSGIEATTPRPPREGRGGGDARWIDRRGGGEDRRARQGAGRLMPGILVIAEARRGELREVSFELIGAALALKSQAGGPVKVAVVDSDAGRHAEALGSEGVDEVLTITSPVAEFEPHVTQRAVD